MRRALSLRSETLAELSTAELEVVAGGTHLTLDCTRYCTPALVRSLDARECPKNG